MNGLLRRSPDGKVGISKFLRENDQAAASLILLPLTFGGVVVFAAMIVPWMIYEGWVVKGSIEPSSRHVRPIAPASALITLMIIGLFLSVTDRAATLPASSS